jgi:hypothetical protein
MIPLIGAGVKPLGLGPLRADCTSRGSVASESAFNFANEVLGLLLSDTQLCHGITQASTLKQNRIQLLVQIVRVEGHVGRAQGDFRIPQPMDAQLPQPGELFFKQIRSEIG